MSISPETSADSHLRRPFRAFGRWWTFWALFPFVPVLPERIVTAFGGWAFNLVWMPLFFWSGLRPMRLWMQRPKPVWLCFLWMGVPFLLFILVTAALRLVGG